MNREEVELLVRRLQDAESRLAAYESGQRTHVAQIGNDEFHREIQEILEADPFDPLPDPDIHWIAVEKLRSDMLEGARSQSRLDARQMVDMFYIWQRQRIRVSHQITAAKQGGRQTTALEWAKKNLSNLERNAENLLGAWAMGYPVVSEWAMRLYGVGPMICSGMLAHLNDIPPETVGHWWSYAGLVPYLKRYTTVTAEPVIAEILEIDYKRGQTVKLEPRHVVTVAVHLRRKVETLLKFASHDSKGNPQTITLNSLARAVARRPDNTKLRTLLWKFATTQVRLYARNPERCVYGRLYYTRREAEKRRNEAGENAEAAAKILEGKNWRPTTNAYACYKRGMLPPAQIHARSLRWISKLFLAHWHQVAYELHYDRMPPRPWVIEHGGHTDIIEPPEWEKRHEWVPGVRPNIERSDEEWRAMRIQQQLEKLQLAEEEATVSE